jgi:hypothetical protein
MRIQDVKRTDKEKKTRKTIVMSIRTTPHISEWMKKNDIMPSKVFHKAIEELQEKEK